MTASAAAILAGGAATRLGGAHKPLLTVGGRAVLARLLEAVSGLVDEVLLIAPDPERYRGFGLRVVPDLRPGLGPLAGLEAALSASTAERLVLVGGDMPFVARSVIALLLEQAPGAPALAPRIGRHAEPLLARYHRRLLPLCAARLDRGDRSLHGLLDEAGASWLDEAALRAADPALRSLFNLNTPEDLARAEALAREG